MHSASTHTSRATVGIFNITFKISINFQLSNIWIGHLNGESDMHSASTSAFRATVSILLEVTTLSHREVAHLNINIKV